MPLIFNIRHLEEKNLQLQGELTAAELEVEALDELIRVTKPLTYNLEAQQMETAILVRGHVRLELDCECARCLKPFQDAIDLPDWACHLALEGEDKVSVVNDCVDLTPQIREDMVLAFPQHPLCNPDCAGLVKNQNNLEKSPGAAPKTEAPSSAWAALDKLKL